MQRDTCFLYERIPRRYWNGYVHTQNIHQSIESSAIAWVLDFIDNRSNAPQR